MTFPFLLGKSTPTGMIASIQFFDAILLQSVRTLKTMASKLTLGSFLKLFIGTTLVLSAMNIQADGPPVSAPSPALAPAPSPTTVRLDQRLNQAGFTPTHLFHAPRSAYEESLLAAGTSHYWQQYSDAEAPVADAFKGYILFSDPHHGRRNHISFLLGTDCSNLVHRIYQMLGARFPYAKTRHLIRLAESHGLTPELSYFQRPNQYPLDLPYCEWQALKARFERVKSPQVGDLLVLKKNIGPRGARGHVGIVSSVSPLRLLHARNKREGIVDEAYSLEGKTFYFLRWNGPLEEWNSSSTAETLLDGTYPSKPYRCPAPPPSQP